MNKPSITYWSTSELGERSRYEAWDALLNENYGTWHSARPDAAGFTADVERLRNDSLTLIKCTCDPCRATRPQRVARAGRENFAAFQLVVAGQERIELDGESFEVGRGDLFVWDSTRGMSFEVTRKLSKISLFMPLEQLRRRLPDDWRGVSGKLPRNSASYLTLKSYMTAMAKPGFAHTEFSGAAMLDAGLAMLAGGTGSRASASPRVAEGQRRAIKDFISANLSDPELSLRDIAAHHGISLRYLHWLFGQTHMTAAAYILNARLNACRSDLQNPAMAGKPISDIAYQWGFNSAAHFSRSYRARFGESPSDTRRGRAAP